MMFRTILAAGCALALLSACSNASPVPKTEAERIAVANEIAGLTEDDAMFDPVFNMMKQQLTSSLASTSRDCSAEKDIAKCQRVEAAVKAEAEAFMDDTLTKIKAMAPELMTDRSAIMAQIYTGEELAKMRDFYASEEGRSIVMKQPQVSAKFMPTVMEKMQGFQTERASELIARLQKARADAEALPGPPASN
jgi:uncharacterized protein